MTMLPKINWNPSNKELGKFGVTVIVGFALIGTAIGFKKSWETAFWVMGVSGGIGLWAIFLPSWSKPFYRLWMGFAFVMGTVISTAVLLMIFYFVITPVGLVMRALGRDALCLKKSSFKKGSYWHPHPDRFDKKYYQRLF